MQPITLHLRSSRIVALSSSSSQADDVTRATVFRSLLMVLGVLLVGVVGRESSMVVGCPTPTCTCSARGVVVCSKKQLDRIPRFYPDDFHRVYEDIDLSDNQIFAVPPYAFDTVNSRSITLKRNPLIGISPRAFVGLNVTNLFRVDLSSCDLRVIHWAVFRNLRQLRDINLAKNSLFAIPRGLFDELDQLQNLSLTMNRLTTVSVSMLKGLKNLQRLDLSSNNLTSIEAASFEDCRQLVSLNLAANRLRQLNVYSFRGLENLQRLILDNNELVGEISPDVFFTLRSLRQIQLANNNLTAIGSRQFSSSPRLADISLTSNRIENVSIDAFYGLTRLQSLHLEDNRLATPLDGCLVTRLLPVGATLLQQPQSQLFAESGGPVVGGSLKELGLSGNPLNCSCDQLWWLPRAVRLVTITGECRHGGPLPGRLVPLAQYYTVMACSIGSVGGTVSGRSESVLMTSSGATYCPDM